MNGKIRWLLAVGWWLDFLLGAWSLALLHGYWAGYSTRWTHWTTDGVPMSASTAATFLGFALLGGITLEILTRMVSGGGSIASRLSRWLA